MRKPRFDRWQFDGKISYPSTASTELSYSDFILNLHTFSHQPSGERRKVSPAWALDNVLLSQLLVHFLEQRVGIKNPTGTLVERMEKAKQASLAQRPRLLLTLNGLCEEYLALERGEIWRPAKTEQPRFTGEGWDEFAQKIDIEKRREILCTEILGLDTLLKYTEKDGGIATIAGCVYLFFRCSLSSVSTAAELGILSPHVRQILFRLHECADKLWPESSSENELEPEPLLSFLLQK